MPYVCKCCGERAARTVTDGCIKSVKRCDACNRATTQKKRRRKGVTPQQCIWVMYCPDHPDKKA